MCTVKAVRVHPGLDQFELLRVIAIMAINPRQHMSSAVGRQISCYDIVEAKTAQPGVTVFKQALNNLKPVVEVKSRRVGGATYQVPVEVRTDRQQALAIRWLIDSARKRGEHTMKERLSGELMDAVNGRGQAVKKREDTHRMADANRAFSHYRW